MSGASVRSRPHRHYVGPPQRESRHASAAFSPSVATMRPKASLLTSHSPELEHLTPPDRITGWITPRTEGLTILTTCTPDLVRAPSHVAGRSYHSSFEKRAT